MEGRLRKTGGISTPHFIYNAAIAYSDIGPDQRLSHGGLLRILQEAAAIASDERGYGAKDVPRTGVCWLLSGWRAELRTRPFWRTHLRTETWPRSLDGFFSERDFLVWQGEELIARIEALNVPGSPAMRRRVRL